MVPGCYNAAVRAFVSSVARSIVVLSAWSGLSACPSAEPAPCTTSDPADPDVDPGGTYRCMDPRLNGGEGCGEGGYPLGFAAKYADRYIWETRPTTGPEAQAFLAEVLVCLQERFLAEATPELSCEEVAANGFDSHVPCYLESGFCGVPLADQFRIFAAVDEEDLGRPGQQEAIDEISQECAPR